MQTLTKQPPASPLGQLIWKDMRLARSLLIAGPCAVFVFYAFAMLRHSFFPNQDPSLASMVVIWILLPNLVALGLPPMLIGTENEQRTFDWLRGLPVTWQQVLTSKVLVSLITWLVTLLTASVAFLFAFYVLDHRFDTLGQVFNEVSLVSALIYSLLLIGCGTMTSWAMRSPIVAVISVFPLMIVPVVVVNSIAEIMRAVLGSNRYFETTNEAAYAVLAFVGILATILVSAILWLSRRRLAGQCEEPWLKSVSGRFETRRRAELVFLTRPSKIGALLWQQTRQTRWFLIVAAGVAVASIALSWSNLSPLAFIVLVMATVLLGTSAFTSDRVGSRQGFFADRGISATLVWWTRIVPSVSVAILLHLVLLVFARESYSWLHEMLPAGAKPFHLWSMYVAIMATVFVIGLAVGQWTRRSTLAHFGGPLVTMFWFQVVGSIFLFYRDYSWTLWPACLVWLFSTWRLNRMLMEGKHGQAIWGRGIGYGMLALAVVCVGVFGHRWMTTPSDMPQWRDEMRAIANDSTPSFPDTPPDSVNSVQMLPQATRGYLIARCQMLPPSLTQYREDVLRSEFPKITHEQALRIDSLLTLVPNPEHQHLFGGVVGANHLMPQSPSPEALRSLLQGELALPETCGGFVGQEDLYELVIRLPRRDGRAPTGNPNYSQRYRTTYSPSGIRLFRRLGIRVALKWARIVRHQQVIYPVLSRLLTAGEANEMIAVAGLRQIAFEQGLYFGAPAYVLDEEDIRDREAFVELVDLLVSDELRQDSRRRAAIGEWKRFDHAAWPAQNSSRAIQGKHYLTNSFRGSKYGLGLERTRTSRMIDKATRTLVNQIDHGLPDRWDPEVNELVYLWSQINGELANPWRYPANRGLYAYDSSYDIPMDTPVFLQAFDHQIKQLRSLREQAKAR